MASPFDEFNRDSFALRRVSSPTSGHFDAQDRWVAPTLTEPAPTIQGHLTTADRMNRENQWGNTQGGVQEVGLMRFFTETLLQNGDVIEADQEGSIVLRYRVMGMVRAHRFMARKLGTPVRYEYEVRQVPQ